MVSLEGLIQDLFFRTNAWKRVLIGGVLCYFLLCFGYLRSLAKNLNDTSGLELPPFTFNKLSVRNAFAALPVGAFYFLIPLFAAYGTDNLLRLVHLEVLSPIPWGLSWICSLTLTSVALVRIPDDAERFFLGLEFEEVLIDWWKLKRVWAWQALACWGLVAVLGAPFYGLTAFIGCVIIIATLKLDPRSGAYAPTHHKRL